MKNKKTKCAKTFSVLVLAAVIAFAMVACDDDSGPGSLYSPGDVAVTGVTLNQTSLSLAVGGSATLIATVSPSNATNKNVAWNSNNTGIATVSSGTVTAVGAGSATITVTTLDGSKTAACSVTVTGGSSSATFTSWREMRSWLETQPDNSVTSPYIIKLNVNKIDTGMAMDYDLKGKYVYFDLSGSTWTEIGLATFQSMDHITGVTIGNSLTKIGSSAFEKCANLTSVTFPNADISIRDNSFDGDLAAAYKAGGKGTYKRSGTGTASTWTKQ